MPISAIRPAPGCIDPEVGGLLRQYCGQLTELSCRERVAVLTHTNRCPACLTWVLDRHEQLMSEADHEDDKHIVEMPDENPE